MWIQCTVSVRKLELAFAKPTKTFPISLPRNLPRLPETRLARPLVKDPQPARVVRVFRVFELQIGEDIRHQIDHREVNVEPVAQFQLRGPSPGRAQRRRKSG